MLSRLQIVLGSHKMLLWTALTAFVLTLPSLWTGLVCDDYELRSVVLQQNNIPGAPSSVCDAYSFVSGNTEIIRKARKTRLYPWWMPDESQFFLEVPGLSDPLGRLCSFCRIPRVDASS